MKTHFLLILTLTAAVLGGVGTVAAQTNESANTVPAEEPGETTTIDLSETTQISEWRYENQTFYVTMRAQTPTRLTITDAGKLSEALSSGSGASSAKIRQRTVTLTGGTTTIEFRATEIDGAGAITLASSRSDGLVAIRSDSIGGTQEPVDWETVATLVVAAAIGAGYWTFREMRRRWSQKNETIERIV